MTFLQQNSIKIFEAVKMGLKIFRTNFCLEFIKIENSKILECWIEINSKLRAIFIFLTLERH